jgi:hypothetical protein
VSKTLNQYVPVLGMQKLIDYLMELQDRIAKVSDGAVKNGLITPNYNAFDSSFNIVRITAETIDYYEKDWSHHTSTFSEELVRRTHTDFINRVGESIKSCLIRTLSHIEYGAKEKIKGTSNAAFDNIRTSLNGGKRVNLSWITTVSLKNQWIDQKTQKEWEAITELRNCIVHNGGIADFDESYEVEGIAIEFRKGQALMFDIGTFAYLIEILLNLYFKWLRKF